MEIDRKLILQEAIHDSLVDSGVDQEDLTAFQCAFDAMYSMDGSGTSDAEIADGVPLTGEQFADASIILVAFSVAKFFLGLMIDPILEEEVLPNLDQYEQEWSERTGNPELVKSLRTHIERTIRKHLGKPFGS